MKKKPSQPKSKSRTTTVAHKPAPMTTVQSKSADNLSRAILMDVGQDSIFKFLSDEIENKMFIINMDIKYNKGEITFYKKEGSKELLKECTVRMASLNKAKTHYQATLKLLRQTQKTIQQAEKLDYDAI